MSLPRKLPLVIGSLPSPFVRKVLAVLHLKGIEYEIDPIVPFYGDDRFSKVSPLRRIPVYIDDRVTLSDSSVICQYLEDRFPEPGVYPDDIVQRANARWLEEFADTRLTDVVIWRIFYPANVKPHVFKAERDLGAIQTVVREELPQVLAFLESVAPQDGFVCGDISIADIALAVHLRNLKWARFGLPDGVAPKAAAWLARTEAHPCLARCNEIADVCVRTPPREHAARMVEMGMRIAGDSLAGTTPRRGPMTV